ncbi:MAG: alkaline shock response membrane anchor protein AmaP [Peptococcaceae bacterium]|nr:alkaline shock response membrane anchor protein AmaP [Peptococcaceae bacterium]
MNRLTKIIYCLVGLILVGYALASGYLLFFGGLPAQINATVALYVLLYGAGVSAGIGLLFILRGIFSRRSYPLMALEQEGGSVTISRTALKNIVYTAVDGFPGVQESRTKIRLSGGKRRAPDCRVRVRIGIAPDSNLPVQHEAMRSRISDAICATTGVTPRRIDLAFYTPPIKHVDPQEGEGSK